VYAVGGLVLILILALVTFWDTAAQRRAAELAPDPPAAPDEEEGGGVVQGFPVPPLDLPHYHGLELGDVALEAPAYGDSTKEVTGA
jgi:NADH-quinone oxidoreductase subunit H